MKTALVVSGRDINVFLTPETDSERMALRYLEKGGRFEVLSQRAIFASEYQAARLTVNKCQGGWLRSYSAEKSVVLCNVEAEE